MTLENTLGPFSPDLAVIRNDITSLWYSQFQIELDAQGVLSESVPVLCPNPIVIGS